MGKECCPNCEMKLDNCQCPDENPLSVGDVIKIASYGFPMYIGELENLSAVLYPAWHDEKRDWHPMTAGFRLHTVLTGKEERVV
jgi:hypothetical protein